ncbi:PTS-dependent dihydroxyacetone kinase 1, dihydroxyacetone-binding subunit DhaK-like [Anthonomus grandis grandis]|uniref:PTS-dependent dihydroxyacetone kinase 1, dihydroxyacetone-binding subunit DhaK-like n=1 Tax=Anthonomus grandis grandis TaxID=2921223 RepID=UPI002165D466|nr:PTS-dependent dihydroxyacetone kinase 1, dihydroxyacetone-binding subunit DhaK-like [Anthonomus grandis grandis]
MDKNLSKDQIDPFLLGYAAYNQEVALFEFGDVIVLKNYKQVDQVRIISGGSLSHIEFVGTGMLTASIQGNQNRPPNPSTILRTIKELSLNHHKGILIIVPASSTDLLNFGLATERAENDDLRVVFLGVPDDCNNNVTSKSDRKGLPGVVLVNKIAGALALTDKSLSQIETFCSKVTENLVSTGTNVKAKLIGARECLYCQKCAMGVDAGDLKKSILKKLSTKDIISDVAKDLLAQLTTNIKFHLEPGDKVVMLANNLGVFNHQDQYTFLKQIIELLGELEVTLAKFYFGPYLVLNYDMDFTLTLLKVWDTKVIELLEASCSAPGWISSCQIAPVSLSNLTIPGCLRRKCRLTPPIKGPKLRDNSANIVMICLQFACDALISCEKMLNTMDGDKGDGDTGTRLRIIAEVLNNRSCDNKLNFNCPFTLFVSLSKLLENTVGGTMGCIYSIAFEAAGKYFGEHSEDEEVNGEMWLCALERACADVKKYGNVSEGEHTMYDPLYACATVFRQKSAGTRYIYGLECAVARAEEVALQTKNRGSKYPDAGAHAVGIWMRAICEAVKLRCLEKK